MKFSGEPTAMFLGLKVPDTVPGDRLVAMALDEIDMIPESKEYLDKTEPNKVAQNNHVGTHWDHQTMIPTNPNRIWCPSGSAGLNLNSVASGSRALEVLQGSFQKENILGFFEFVKWKLQRAGMNKVAEEFVNRIEAKTPTEFEDFSSVKLWNYLNLPYQMLMEMVQQGFTDSPPAPVLYLPPVTASFVIPQPGWKPASSGTDPEIGFVGPIPIGEVPFIGETLAVKPNLGLVCVSATKPEICLADFNEQVEVERAEAEGDGSGGKRKAGADLGEADEHSVLKKREGHTDSLEFSSFETLQ